MYYNNYGNRDKDLYPFWAHNKVDNPNFKVKQCLFGEHLLNNNAEKVIIVESEKTAIMMGYQYLRMGNKNIVVLATGGIHNLTVEKFRVFQGLNKDITLIADVGAENQWRKNSELINEKLGLNTSVCESRKFIEIAMKASKYFKLQDGQDVADYLTYMKFGYGYVNYMK
jgi:hypothetical protein